MSKKFYRWYGMHLSGMEKWLNRMSEKGMRLSRCGKLSWEFEDCTPGQYLYKVEFVGNLSREKSEDYRVFLESMGYRTVYKSLNADYSIGKAVLRPWADKGARISTTGTTYNREILIIEKVNDGGGFQLRTTNADRIKYLKTLQKPWVWYLIVFGVPIVFMPTLSSKIIFGAFAAYCLLQTVFYGLEIQKAKKAALTEE